MKIRKAVIPAAGLGSRMLPAAKTVPKEMFPVADRPVLHYIVEEAVAAGIEEIIILTNRSKTVMHDYFDYTPELEESSAPRESTPRWRLCGPSPTWRISPSCARSRPSVSATPCGAPAASWGMSPSPSFSGTI